MKDFRAKLGCVKSKHLVYKVIKKIDFLHKAELYKNSIDLYKTHYFKIIQKQEHVFFKIWKKTNAIFSKTYFLSFNKRGVQVLIFDKKMFRFHQNDFYQKFFTNNFHQQIFTNGFHQ